MEQIKPIILAGGTGTRLWPLSRKTYPKQFSSVVGEQTLFQQTAQRLTTSNFVEFLEPNIVTNSDFRFIVEEQLNSIGLKPGSIIIEPEVKNTSPAILAATIKAYREDRDSILLVLPSDHFISSTDAFHKAIQESYEKVLCGKIVTFGILPSYPETGYGYLKLSDDNSNGGSVSAVSEFIEKPILSEAKKMVNSNQYLWNTGIYFFRASEMIKAFKMFSPENLKRITKSIDEAKKDLGFIRLDPKSWGEVDNISIDFEIMEKARNLVVTRIDISWSDLGSWDTVWSKTDKDENGVALTENSHAFNCSNTLLRSESPRQQIVGIGLENIIAVAMPDAVLVAEKKCAQDVKKAVEFLKINKITQGETSPIDHRPWGSFESLAFEDRFQVKRIKVKPGAALSLQSHFHRSEHWIVVEGTAKVTVDGEAKLVTEGQSVFVPLGAVHRLENPGNISMVLIEVQTGRYLGEDDIVRYEDLYKR